MSSGVRVGARGLAIAMAATMLGCAVVDQYSGRAIVYNLEAEQAQDQALLLNIVRAYLRRPMQFTTVSTITGIASASGSVQYTLPTNVPFRPATQGATGIAAFPPLPTWLFGGSISGGPAFTVPVLDTQEFYQGILKPIPAQIWDLYIEAGYPRSLLFDLFVLKVVMKRADGACPSNDHLAGCEFVFQNYVGNDTSIDLFQALADYLLALGFTLQPPKPVTVPIDDQKTVNVNVRYLGSPTANEPNRAQVLAPPGGSGTSESQPAAKPYVICFEPHTAADNDCIVRRSLCGPNKSGDRITQPAFVQSPVSRTCRPPGVFTELNADERRGLAAPEDAELQPSGSATVNIIASREFIYRLMWIVANDKKLEEGRKADLRRELWKFAMRPVTIKIYLRHTEGIIYYLGEIARRQLDPEYADKRSVFVREYGYYTPREEGGCEPPTRGCGYIFNLQEGTIAARDGFVSMNYAGRWFSLPGPYVSSTGYSDYSSLSFGIVKELLALNSSAKSLPQSSVITTVGQ